MLKLEVVVSAKNGRLRDVSGHGVRFRDDTIGPLGAGQIDGVGGLVQKPCIAMRYSMNPCT